MKKVRIALFVTIGLSLASCANSVKFSDSFNSSRPNNNTYIEQHRNNSIPSSITGQASYYADKFDGRLTANGERFDQKKLTAAHKTLPFGTLLKVTNLDNGKSVKVRVNDRGPFVGDRILDLSKSAAKQIGMIDSGLANVQIEIQ